MTIQISEEISSGSLATNDRKIINSSSAFGILRQQLIKNIGEERVSSFLFHFGWENGVNDAQEALKTNLTLEELIKHGPVMHIKNGHIRGIRHDCSVQFDDNQNIKSYYSTGAWIDSYEAAEHIKREGISKTPVCHTLIGYCSGFMSTVTGEELLAKEIECVGSGDKECRWILTSKKEWERGQDNKDFYNEVPIVKELEVTYEQLISKQKLVTRLAEFQKKLAEEITNGDNLQTFCDKFFSSHRHQIILTDIENRTLAYSGMSEEKYLQLKEDMDSFYRENKGFNELFNIRENKILPFRKKIVRTQIQERLITPIIVQREVIGFCALIYKDLEPQNHDEDYLFVDRFANAVSIILLNEKTKFESFERMKGNFLNQIIDAKLPTNDMIMQGRYTGVDLTKPYYLLVIEFKKSSRSIEEDFLLQDQIYETTSRYFSNNNLNVLVGQREGNIVLFMSKPLNFNETIKEYQKFLINKFDHGEFKLGISNLGEKIEHASKRYEEAMIAIRLTLKKGIVPFHSLGIIGILINSNNINGIKMIAEQELGPLYNTNNSKTRELLKTLYYFLLNGGKLEQTMEDLALSMSGLRHRISKIESMLGKDLRDPNETYQLLLILKSLIAMGELD